MLTAMVLLSFAFAVHTSPAGQAIFAVRASPKVQLGNTTLIGTHVPGLDQDFFGGIPFAEPPVGRLRLQHTITKSTLDSSTFDASTFGLSCLQPGLPAREMSEDCLTINVLRPSGLAPNALLPVMFWTFGGAFFYGSANLYNGSAIVAQSVARGTPIIYVNYNYRLGPLGWPQGQEAADKNALNLGLSDQLAALTWVQENIGLFGGDKTKVTVFGQSAGAVMTATQLLNPNFTAFARGAILQSGSAASPFTFHASRRQSDWTNFVAGVPACAGLASSNNTFDCLQSANSSDILEGLVLSIAQESERLPAWSPTLDGPGRFMPDLPSVLFSRGQFARIPFITGTTLDEGTIFTPLPEQNYTTNVIRDSLKANFTPPADGVSEEELNAAIDHLLELYPDIPALGAPFNTGNETFGLSSGYKRMSAILGDIVFESQRRFWIQTASNAGVKSYGYSFTEPQPSLASSVGVAHSSDIPFVYGGVVNGTESALGLSKMMIDYWVSFATSLDPSDGLGISRPTWEQYTPDNQVVMQLHGANTTLIRDDYREKQMSFITSIPTVFHHFS